MPTIQELIDLNIVFLELSNTRLGSQNIMIDARTGREELHVNREYPRTVRYKIPLNMEIYWIEKDSPLIRLGNTINNVKGYIAKDYRSEPLTQSDYLKLVLKR